MHYFSHILHHCSKTLRLNCRRGLSSHWHNKLEPAWRRQNLQTRKLKRKVQTSCNFLVRNMKHAPFLAWRWSHSFGLTLLLLCYKIPSNIPGTFCCTTYRYFFQIQVVDRTWRFRFLLFSLKRCPGFYNFTQCLTLLFYCRLHFTDWFGHLWPEFCAWTQWRR